jgi:hypothetical protein
MQEKQDSVKARIVVAIMVAVLYLLAAGAYGTGVSAAQYQEGANKIVSQAR